MDALTSGACNIAMGINALGASTTGCYNVAIGATAMGGADVTGNFNVALGIQSMDALTTGLDNVAIGRNALGASTTGCYNVALGRTAMGAADTSGSHNVAIGHVNSDALTTGCHNVGIGKGTLTATTSGCFNVGIGFVTLDNMVSTNHHVAIGYNAGGSVSSGERTVNVGKSANKTGSDQGCIMGCIYLDLDDTSDCRAKTSISTSDLGLDFINAIRPVKYKYKVPRDLMKDENGDIIVGSADSEGLRKSKQFQYGLIAQEIETVLSDLGIAYLDFAGVSDHETDQGKTVGTKSEADADPDNVWYPGPHDYDPGHSSGIYQKTKSIRYLQFISPLIKAVQELSAENIALAARVTDLE